MAESSTEEVPSAALHQVVCVIDGLIEALDHVASYGQAGYNEAAIRDSAQLSELRAELLPGRPNDPDWRAKTFGSGREWYVSIAYAFTHGVPSPPTPG